MRTIALFLALLVVAPSVPTLAGHAHESVSSVSAVKCECPPDCHCHQPGGTCPGDTCVADCDCDQPTVAGVKVHPDIAKTVQVNEILKTAGKDISGKGDFILVKNKAGQIEKQFTGFRPTETFYRNAKVITVKADPELIAKFKAAGGRDNRKISYYPVHGQVQGSCWAEATCGAHTLNVNSTLGPLSRIVLAVNDIIRCSRMGTARGGGDLAFDYSGPNGIALESDMPYTGTDGSCDKTVERHYPLKDWGIVRGESGGFPNEAEVITAYILYNTLGVCGSAGALGDGSGSMQPGGGNTNHCYVDGAILPNPDGWWEHYFMNSWGDGTKSRLNPGGRNWGNKGWGGPYKQAKEPGGKIWGSRMTEIMIPYAGPILPMEPILFSISGLKAVADVTLAPEDQGQFTQTGLTKTIKAAIDAVELQAVTR